MWRSSSCSNYSPSFDLYVIIKLAFRTESIKGHIVMKSVTPSSEWGRELRSHWASIHVLGVRNLLYMFVSCITDHPGHGRRLSSVTQHHLSENASVDNDENSEEIWIAERYFESFQRHIIKGNYRFCNSDPRGIRPCCIWRLRASLPILALFWLS